MVDTWAVNLLSFCMHVPQCLSVPSHSIDTLSGQRTLDSEPYPIKNLNILFHCLLEESLNESCLSAISVSHQASPLLLTSASWAKHFPHNQSGVITFG